MYFDSETDYQTSRKPVHWKFQTSPTISTNRKKLGNFNWCTGFLPDWHSIHSNGGTKSNPRLWGGVANKETPMSNPRQYKSHKWGYRIQSQIETGRGHPAASMGVFLWIAQLLWSQRIWEVNIEDTTDLMPFFSKVWIFYEVISLRMNL